MIPGDLLSAFPHRQFHTLPSLLDSWAALPNSYPNACMPMQGGSLYHFYDGLWYDPAERRTHDLPCERRTRYRLSQPDTVVTSQAQLATVCQIYTQPLYMTLFFTHACSYCLILHFDCENYTKIWHWGPLIFLVTINPNHLNKKRFESGRC